MVAITPSFGYHRENSEARLVDDPVNMQAPSRGISSDVGQKGASHKPLQEQIVVALVTRADVTLLSGDAIRLSASRAVLCQSEVFSGMLASSLL